MTIQMKATEQYFPMVLFIFACKVIGLISVNVGKSHTRESNYTAVT